LESIIFAIALYLSPETGYGFKLYNNKTTSVNNNSNNNEKITTK
jgi:hypothetical protein